MAAPLGRVFGTSDADALRASRMIAEAATVEEVWALITAALEAHGFERVNYGFTRYRLGQGIGDPDDAFFLSTHSLERVRWFHESGLYLRTADYRWTRENVGACSWGWAQAERAAGRLSAEECAAMDELGTARQRAGYSISFGEGAPRSKGAMGLAAGREATQAQVDTYWQEHGDKIVAMCSMAHFKLSQLPLPVPRAELRPRQVQILEWIADGKTNQDVAILTGLSVSAVDKHLRAAREALAVETTAQAIAKLSFLNQLFRKPAI